MPQIAAKVDLAARAPHRNDGIEYGPEEERYDYFRKAPAEEALCAGKEQIARCKHEQRHGAAGGRIEQRYPQRIAGRGYVGAVGIEIKRLYRMDEYYHEAGRHAQVVQKYDSPTGRGRFHMTILCFVRRYAFLRNDANRPLLSRPCDGCAIIGGIVCRLGLIE